MASIGFLSVAVFVSRPALDSDQLFGLGQISGSGKLLLEGITGPRCFSHREYRTIDAELLGVAADEALTSDGVRAWARESAAGPKFGARSRCVATRDGQLITELPT
ncbi:hypothetical protein B296_00040580 [Ensete ventricosum]|uniref:Uncharacterized protein n=1 Tax=Ensete ventricosum TaxID=4639 RepID=A0A426X1N7_ENSVE|nr:hypothetical protein B296_00040580 [Ensete ventricosum]